MNDVLAWTARARAVAVVATLAWALLCSAPASAQEATAGVAATSLTVGGLAQVAGTGGAGLSLRSGPGADNAVLQGLSDGATVQVLSGPIVDAQTSWYRLQTQGVPTVVGYSSAAFLVNAAGTSNAIGAPAAAVPVPVTQGVTLKVSGYALGAGAVGTRTASGTQTHWGTVAADTHIFPFGTRLAIDGFAGTVFTVEDTGSGVHGLLLDVWFPSPAGAISFGTQQRRATPLAVTASS